MLSLLEVIPAAFSQQIQYSEADAHILLTISVITVLNYIVFIILLMMIALIKKSNNSVLYECHLLRFKDKENLYHISRIPNL